MNAPKQTPHESSPLGHTGVHMKALTEKQVQVLELLCRQHTSKEIGRILGISRHTVDQRVASIRTKWDLGTRQEIVRMYQQLAHPADNLEDATCEPLIYEPSQVGSIGPSRQVLPQNRMSPANGVEPLPPTALSLIDRLDLRLGSSGRFVAVVGLSFTMALTMVLVLEIADVLEGLL